MNVAQPLPEPLRVVLQRAEVEQLGDQVVARYRLGRKSLHVLDAKEIERIAREAQASVDAGDLTLDEGRARVRAALRGTVPAAVASMTPDGPPLEADEPAVEIRVPLSILAATSRAFGPEIDAASRLERLCPPILHLALTPHGG